MGFTLESRSFADGAVIPRKCTGDGQDASPPLAWGEPPAGTAAFVLVCDDPDAPAGNWVHWVLYDLPPETRSLAEGLPKTDTIMGAAKQGVNDFRTIGYNGPAPPPGYYHRYVFTLYAVDKPTGLPAKAKRQAVLDAIQGHTLGKAVLTGKYKR